MSEIAYEQALNFGGVVARIHARAESERRRERDRFPPPLAPSPLSLPATRAITARLRVPSLLASLVINWRAYLQAMSRRNIPTKFLMRVTSSFFFFCRMTLFCFSIHLLSSRL